MRLTTIAATVATLCFAAAGAAVAGPLNTGVNADGSTTTPGTLDNAWTGVDVTQEIPVLPAYAVSGYYGAWYTTPNAQWISPVVATDGTTNAANYGYSANDYINWSQTFTLTANGAASDILGLFAVDNALVGIVITNANGIFNVNVSAGSFTALTGFDIPVADLVAGTNTITFETENFASESGNPTGLLVEFTQVPEPASAALFGVGMLALAMASRRRSGA